MHVGSRGDEQIHDSSPGLTPRFHDGCGHEAVAWRHVIIDGERIESTLNTEASQALGAHIGRRRRHDPTARVELCGGHRTS